jgi:peroxiredoxin
MNMYCLATYDGGFGSLAEAADAVAAYNPHRARPTDLDGLRKNLRERAGRYYWHWDPRFMDINGGGLLPTEIQDVDRLHAAVTRIVADMPVILVRGRASDLVSAEKAAGLLGPVPDCGVRGRLRRRSHGRRRSQRRVHF